MRHSQTQLARSILVGKPKLFGAPGAPIIRMATPRVPWKWRSYDIIVEHTHRRKHADARLIHYLGKHQPQPQKSLWSPDTPVTQDRHLFMLTTFDIDAFKYWFGVRRCLISHKPWRLLAKAGLLPPPIYDNTPLIPRPIFEKEALMKYYLAHKSTAQKQLAWQSPKRKYFDYKNGLQKSAAQRAADVPSAPWL
jgi:hypothetical protein